MNWLTWGSGLATSVLAYALLFAKKRMDYRRVQRKQGDILARHAGRIRLHTFAVADLPSFENRFVIIEQFLPHETFSLLLAAVGDNGP